jgi:hypothetical protein
VSVKRIDMKDNPLFPLPRDYEELTSKGMRWARLHACRQYLLDWDDGRSDNMMGAKVFASCVNFFDKYYLWPDHEYGFNPMFYDMEPLQEAPLHWYMQEAYWRYRLNLLVCMRGSAKTGGVRKRMAMRALCEPTFTNVYATSNNDNAKITGEALQMQFKHNERITDDFSLLMPDGRIVPRKGDGSYSSQALKLENGSRLWFTSIESKQRGRRPKAYELDDPEADAKSSTSMADVRRSLEDTIFRVIMPMMLRPNTRSSWTATFVSRRHYAWHAMADVTLPDGTKVPKDERYGKWNRTIIRLSKTLEDGKIKSNWPHMWPASDEEKKELGLADDTQTLDDVKQTLGYAVYMAEMEANPGAAAVDYFPIDRTSDESRERFGYWFEQPDGNAASDPRNSETLVCYYSYDGASRDLKKVPYREFLKTVTPFATLDTSYTSSSHSDFKVCHVLGVTPEREIFSLDLWDGRCDESVLVKQAFTMADKWRCHSLWPEVVARQATLYRTMMEVAKGQIVAKMGLSHTPAIKPLRVGMESKTSKIAGLRVFFDHNLVKLPWPRMVEAPYRRLFDQFEQFNPEADDGGLENDDHIDTFQMSQAVNKRVLARDDDEPNPDFDPIEELKKGNLYVEGTGVPMMSLVDFSQVKVSDVMEIMSWRKNDERGTVI